MRKLLNNRFKLDLILSILCAIIVIQFILPILDANLSKNLNHSIEVEYENGTISSPQKILEKPWKHKE